MNLYAASKVTIFVITRLRSYKFKICICELDSQSMTQSYVSSPLKGILDTVLDETYFEPALTQRPTHTYIITSYIVKRLLKNKLNWLIFQWGNFPCQGLPVFRWRVQDGNVAKKFGETKGGMSFDRSIRCFVSLTLDGTLEHIYLYIRMQSASTSRDFNLFQQLGQATFMGALLKFDRPYLSQFH